jgi:hypothetical protein
MRRYAEKTQVASDASRAEIERTLRRYGADSFLYGWSGDRAMIGFRMRGRMIRFFLAMPDRESDEFRLTPSCQWARDPATAQREWEQACRQRWRALALVIKAKLEAVEAKIVNFEEEFLANVLLPDNQTVGEWMAPQVEEVYQTGRMPELLPGLRALPAAGDK